MPSSQRMVCLDLEGVLVPEIWINVAEKTGIPALRRTTRDEPDYDKLMRARLAILDQNGLTLPDIQAVIATLRPIEGARELLDWIRTEYQAVILSDTFTQFAAPLMRQLGHPALFCHTLETDASQRIVNYHLRLPDQKRRSVLAFKELNYSVTAVGDSYNDTSMLLAADAGILFRPPDNVIEDFPQLPVVRNYEDLRKEILKSDKSDINPAR